MPVWMVRVLVCVSMLVLGGLGASAFSGTFTAMARSAASTPPPCRSQALAGSVTLQGATGSLAGGILVTNTGHSTCSLANPPHVTLLSAGSAVSVSVHVDWKATIGAAVGMIDLQPHAQARAFVQWLNWCSAEVQAPLTMLITLPKAKAPLGVSTGTGFQHGLAPTPRCDQAGKPSVLQIGPFDPADLVYDHYAQVIRLYYQAINEQDYRHAWLLLAPNGRPTFNIWEAGYQATAHVSLDRLVVPGYRIKHGKDKYTCAGVRLTAKESAGPTRSYGGWYLTRTGSAGQTLIVPAGSRIQENGSLQTPSRATCAAEVHAVLSPAKK